MTGPDPVVKGHQDYFQAIFRRCVAAILGSYATHIDPEAFEYIVLLAETHMQELYTSLASIARIQRRSQPSVEDLALLFCKHNINPSDLLEEKKLHTKYTEQLAALQFDPELEPVPDTAQAFFDNNFQNIMNVVPSKRKMPTYVPKWMPPLPPDHTYMESPVFTNHVRSLQVLREQLVEEGRLAERALQRLLGQGGSESLLEVVEVAPRSREALSNPSEAPSYITVVDETEPATEAPPAVTTESAESVGEVVEQEASESVLGSASEPANGPASEPASEPANEPANEPASETAPPTESVTEPAVTAEGSRIKLKLPKLRLSVGKEPSRPISLSISLGKPPGETRPAPKRPKTSDIFGKRPKLDIVQLAKEHKPGQPVGPFKPWDRSLSAYDAPALPTLNEAFAAALSALEK